MINYNLLSERFSTFFGTKIEFEKNSDSFLITRHNVPKRDGVLLPIYSSEFSFNEKECNFIIWSEIPAEEKNKYIHSVAILNSFHNDDRKGSIKFELNENIGRLWVGVRYTFRAYDHRIDGRVYPILSTDLCLRIFDDFCEVFPSWKNLTQKN